MLLGEGKGSRDLVAIDLVNGLTAARRRPALETSVVCYYPDTSLLLLFYTSLYSRACYPILFLFFLFPLLHLFCHHSKPLSVLLS